MSSTAIQDVWSFWFGELSPSGDPTPQVARRWFAKDAAFDQEVRDRFAGLHAEVAAGQHEDWRGDLRGALAYVIVLDQFSRNMFRDTPAMFATDPQALAAAKDAVARGFDREAPKAARGFFYMPYMHSEELADQQACIGLFEQMGGAKNAMAFAEKHRAIIERFGRFPHRNAILGRASTPEEEEFLKGPDSAF